MGFSSSLCLGSLLYNLLKTFSLDLTLVCLSSLGGEKLIFLSFVSAYFVDLAYLLDDREVFGEANYGTSATLLISLVAISFE